ncbi:MAG: hypothetical protein KJ672_05225 [Candidatus Thermoplasmatota archaeon]|nr:hypothetical protein [Candidatus Thermoplasmatota archaeon]
MSARPSIGSAEKRKYYLSIKDQTGIDAFLPKGIIVIGRHSEEDKELLKAHKEFLHSLDIWTYDDLLASANRTIEIVRDIKVKECSAAWLTSEQDEKEV